LKLAKNNITGIALQAERQLPKTILATIAVAIIILASAYQVYYNDIPRERLVVSALSCLFITTSYQADRDGDLYPSR
jgi:hypothetical protein